MNEFAQFQGLTINLDQLKTELPAEVEAGVSGDENPLTFQRTGAVRLSGDVDETTRKTAIATLMAHDPAVLTPSQQQKLAVAQGVDAIVQSNAGMAILADYVARVSAVYTGAIRYRSAFDDPTLQTNVQLHLSTLKDEDEDPQKRMWGNFLVYLFSNGGRLFTSEAAYYVWLENGVPVNKYADLAATDGVTIYADFASIPTLQERVTVTEFCTSFIGNSAMQVLGALVKGV